MSLKFEVELLGIEITKWSQLGLRCSIKHYIHVLHGIYIIRLKATQLNFCYMPRATCECK